jgi:hypothetical protein
MKVYHVQSLETCICLMVTALQRSCIMLHVFKSFLNYKKLSAQKIFKYEINKSILCYNFRSKMHTQS